MDIRNACFLAVIVYTLFQLTEKFPNLDVHRSLNRINTEINLFYLKQFFEIESIILNKSMRQN